MQLSCLRLVLGVVLGSTLLVPSLLHAETTPEGPYRLVSPPGGNPPYPAVLFVPGCSGFVAANGVNSYEEHAADLRTAGYAVVFVDFITKRMQTNCAHVSQSEVSADILEAATWVRTQTGIDPDRISVIGWSFGGGAVLAALKAMQSEPPIAKAVMYCPVCRGAVPWSADVSGLMLLGDKDDVAVPSLCNAVAAGMPADKIRLITYPDARHGFDARGLPERTVPGAPSYNPEAAKASWSLVLDFLK